MDESLSSQPILEAPADIGAAIAVYLAETQRLLDQMQADQTDMDRLKEENSILQAEIQTIKSETQAILAQLEAAV